MPVRIYELAHEFDIPSKEMVEFCREAGLDVKSHSSTIDEDEAAMVRRRMAGQVIDEEPEEAVGEAVEEAPPPEPEPEPEPELTPEEQIARARGFEIHLPSARRRPEAIGLKLVPAAAVVEEEPEEAAVAVAEAPTEVAEEVEAAEEAPAEVEVEKEAPAEVAAEAEAPPAEEVEVEEVEEAEEAQEAQEAEVEAEVEVEETEETEEVEEAQEVEAKAGPRRHLPRVKPPGGPKVAPRPTRPRAHPQAAGAPEAPPEPHPQAVGMGPAAFPKGKTKLPPRPTVPPPHPEAEAAEVAEPEAPPRKHRGKAPRETEEEEASRRRAQAFRRRERSRQREEQEMIDQALGRGGATGGVVNERVRIGRGGRLAPKPRGSRAVRPEPVAGPKKATVEPPITVKRLSAALGVKASGIISYLMAEKQMMATINDTLPLDMAEEVALHFDITLTVRAERELADIIQEIEAREDPEDALVPRPPVVAFLGHVDHGKTSLMDHIRQARVAEGEAGGITQHIGAYRVPVDDRWLTFLDTPGHEAFTAMRARGAQATDICVLVVAADDGVMPQTEEAINHAKAAGVPIVVAVNKCDLPTANPQRVREQMTRFELVAEEWGGQTIMVDVSAITGENIDKLLESLLLEAELLELKANPDREAVGIVIEAERTEGLGPVATLLVKDGTLTAGDYVLAGTAYGRVRALRDEKGKRMRQAGPSQAVQVAGLSDVPRAGEKFYVLDDLTTAKEIAEDREHRRRETQLADQRRPRTLEAVFEQMTTEEAKELPLIIKADVQGSVEAIRENLLKIEHPEVRVRVVHTGVGGITESDVLLADASDAIIMGFNAVPDAGARTEAEERGVDIRQYSVIYRITEDVRAALEGMLAPTEQQRRLGEAAVQQVFKISRLGTIAGCLVSDGTIHRNARVRVVRDGLVVYEGAIDSLKRFKDDVREVRAGQECGIKVAGYNDLKVDDRLEAFETVEVARTLDLE